MQLHMPPVQHSNRCSFPLDCSVGRLKRHMAEICVKAVLAVADLDRKDVNLDLIKVSTCPSMMSLLIEHGAFFQAPAFS